MTMKIEQHNLLPKKVKDNILVILHCEFSNFFDNLQKNGVHLLLAKLSQLAFFARMRAKARLKALLITNVLGFCTNFY